MAWPLVVLAAASAISGARDAVEESEYNAAIYRKNAKTALENSEDAVSRGKFSMVRTQVAAKSMVGSQRAAMAAQGIDIGSGSAADVQADTMATAEIQNLMIKNNAAREAWGFIAQAGDYEMSAKLGLKMGENRARASLLTGAANVYSGYKK